MPHRSQVSPFTIWTVGLHLLLMGGVLVVLRQTWTVVTWILIALFIALALDPAVRWLQAHRVRRGFAILAVFIAAVGVLALLFINLVPMVIEQARTLVQSAPDLLARLQQTTAFQWADGRFALQELGAKIARASGVGQALAVAGKVAEGLAASITVTSLTVFMLLFGGDLFERLLAWFEPGERERYRYLARRMHRRVGGYVSGTLLISLIAGAVIGSTLAILGNPYFLPLGLVMIVLGIIPWVGSALGALLVASTTFAAQGGKAALIVIAIYLVYQQVEGHLLQPLVQRHTIRMNPLLIAMVMLIGTALTGLLGALLALPVAGAVQVVLQDLLAQRELKWRRRERLEHPDPRQLPLWDDDARKRVEALH
jgi:predicted PurR-regulated permease PerM